MKNGSIAAEGTFDSLQASGLDFAELLKSDNEEETNPKEVPEVDNDVTGSREFVRHLSVHSVSFPR